VRHSTGNHRRSIFVGVSLLLALLVAPWAQAPAGGRSGPQVEAVVMAVSTEAAAEAVRAVGGTVERELALVSGVSATLAMDDVDRLAALPGVVSVSPNSPVTFQSESERPCSDYKSKAKRKKCRERRRLEGLRIQRVVNADDLWKQGLTGRGVNVAILDTGVYSDHTDLAGRVVACEDFSDEFDGPAALPTQSPTPLPSMSPVPTLTPLPSISPLPTPSISIPPVVRQGQDEPPISEQGCSDPFGHGTFMAGLAVGDGTTSGGRYSGTAPDAGLIGIKVAGYDGSTDISKILAGIQWAVSFKDVYDIGVLNLSLGSDSAQPYLLSPLNYAVEKAWQAGIVVVVSAGNSGPDASTVMKPGDDPYVITVGSSNDGGTVKVSDDRVPPFSSRGPTRADGLSKPDIVSPGVHTVSLRSPGSAIDQQFPSARVKGAYFRGSGTSMSTATVSGIVALMLQADPSLTPDAVKCKLMNNARSIGDTDPFLAGAGLVDAFAAVHGGCTTPVNVGLVPSTGLGSIDADRPTEDFGAGTSDEDTVQVLTPLGQLTIDGEVIAASPSEIDPTDPGALVPWAAVNFTESDWTPESWAASTWKGSDWSASTWKASTWKATQWEASTWKGTEWSNPDWDASTWKDHDWNASTWKASTWKSAWYAVAWD
jgi:serine protease AprX